MNPRPMFPPAFDSTMIGTLRSCPQKFYLQYMQHWKSAGEESVHLVAGGAFAAGIEAARRAFYESGSDPETSLLMGVRALLAHYPSDWVDPDDATKTIDRMVGALDFYFENYPLGRDHAPPVHWGNARGIEFSFALPLPINHPQTGQPILYTGRADMVADAYGGVFVFDEKTTSRLGGTWARQWDLRSQFTGYCWALREYGRRANGVVVRGVSILKEKDETQQAITYRAPWEVERWLATTLDDIQRAVAMWETGKWPFNLDHACTEYGGCTFAREVCKSPEPERWLPVKFTRRVWSPVHRTNMTPEEWERLWMQ